MKNANTTIMQLPPDRAQWSAAILKAFYREHNYIKPDSVKVVLRDGVAVNDAGGIVVKKAGLSFLVPVILRDGSLASFDTAILQDQSVIPLTPYSIQMLLASSANEDGKAVKAKPVAQSTGRLPRPGAGVEGPIKLAGDLTSCFNKLAGLARATGVTLSAKVQGLMESLKEPEAPSVESIKVATVKRYGDLYELTGYYDKKGPHRDLHFINLNRETAEEILKEAGLSLPDVGKNEETLVVKDPAQVEVIPAKDEQFLNKEAAYLLFDAMSVVETTDIGSAYKLEKTASVHPSDLVAFWGSINGTPVFTEAVSVTESHEGILKGHSLSSFKEYSFKKSASIKYPTKQGDTILIPEAWSLMKVGASSKKPEAVKEYTTLSRLGDMWFIKEAGKTDTYHSSIIDVALGLKGMTKEAIDLAKGIVHTSNKALIAFEVPQEKTAATAAPAKTGQVRPSPELKIMAIKVAAALTDAEGVEEASIKQLLMLPALDENAAQDLISVMSTLVDIKGFLSEYLLKYRLEAEDPDDGLIGSIKALIVNIEDLEQNIYMGA